MNKALITRVWIAGLVAGVAGLIVAAVGTGIMLGLGGQFVWRGHEVVGFTPNFGTGFWTGVGLVSGGGLLLVGGAITQFVSWIGALLNTWRLEDKFWFVLLLVIGLLRFEFVIMLIYILAGPDGLEPRRPAPAGGGSLAPVPG